MKLIAHIKFWAWKVVTMLILGPIYIAIISEGLRTLIPALGQRISRIPFLDFFDDFDATHRLDLAHLMSLVLLIAVWWLWDRLLTIWLGGDFDAQGFNAELFKKIIYILGTTIVGTDACLFFLSVTQSTWGGSSFSFSAILATACYLAILIFVSFVSCVLRRDLLSFTKEK